MLQFEELRLRLSAREDEVQEYRQAIGYEGLQRKLAELEEKTTVPGFWNDVEKSQKNQLETAKVIRLKSKRSLQVMTICRPSMRTP